MANLTVYSARACPFAHRTRLVLAEKRLTFELVEIDLQNKPAWFSSVSVYGKVPALDHDGKRFVESAIINEYLEEFFPEPRLLPRSPEARAAARIWVDYANTRFVPAWGAVLRGATQADRTAGTQELDAALLFIETHAFGGRDGSGPFLLGSELSLVDFAFYPWFERWAALEYYRGVQIPQRFERLTRWRELVSGRDAARETANPTSFYLERYAQFAQAPQRATAG